MKTVVLGAGRMGRRHVQIVREMGLRLVGVADPKGEALAAAAEEFALAGQVLYTDARRLLHDHRPECVIVATTAQDHCGLTCAAAEAGAKFILCEKPMATSLEDCDRMITACREAGARLTINHQMRFMEQYTGPKALLETEAFGGLTSVTVVAGNFGLAMNGSHYFEMFRFMTDEPPATAQAWFSSEKVSNPRGPQFEDRAGSVRLTTRSGKRFYMEIGADQGHGMQAIYSGRYGQIIVNELTGAMHMSHRREEHRSLPTTRYGMPAVEENVRMTPADSLGPSRSVLEALVSGGQAPTPEEGRLAVAALVACYVSDETGHSVVPVDDRLPSDRTFPWA